MPVKRHLADCVVAAGAGCLTGKYLPGATVPIDSRAASPTMGSMFDKAFLSRPVLEAMQQIKPLAAEQRG